MPIKFYHAQFLETSLRINSDFNLMEVEKEMNYLNLLPNLSNEKDIFKEFIMHLSKDTVKECLVAMSQDEHFSDAQCKNLLKIGVNLQIKSAKLCNKLVTKQLNGLQKKLDS